MGRWNTFLVHRIKHLWRRCLFLVALLFLMVGCSPGEPLQMASLDITAEPVYTARADLRHSPLGMVQMVWDQQKQDLMVQISLTGAMPDSMHPAHIFSGSCRDIQPADKVLHRLKTVVADKQGFANTITTISHVKDGIPANGWYVLVHNGPALNSQEEKLAIACADIAHTGSATKIQASMNGTSAPNQSASGTAQLSIDAAVLLVTLTMQDLEPGSKLATYLHSGSCASQGKDKFPLQELVADASGTASATTRIEKVRAIPHHRWYITIHLMTDSSHQTPTNMIACGDVIAGQE